LSSTIFCLGKNRLIHPG